MILHLIGEQELQGECRKRIKNNMKKICFELFKLVQKLTNIYDNTGISFQTTFR